MITVTSPDGVRIQYNTAHHVSVWNSTTGSMKLSEAGNGGRIVALVPAGWMIEWVTPCRTYAAQDGDALRQAAEFIEAKPRTTGQQDGYLERIKHAIAAFDLRRRCFK